MTQFSTSPAPARTDVDARLAPRPTLTDSQVRRLGLTLSAGTLAWSAAGFAVGFDAATEAGTKLGDLTGLAFQGGLMALLTVQARSRATGLSRVARGMIKVERVVLTLAMVWSLVHALVPAARGTVWLGVLDACWPLSMLGMFVIGVKIAITGRWQGLARFWPLVAESWVVVTLPALGIFGQSVGNVVGASHLLVGYLTLGLILAARPQLVRARD